MPLHAITFGNLRPYLKPPPAPQSLGCYAAMLRYTLPLRPGLGFWPVAQAIHQNVYHDARRGDKFSAVLLSPLLVGATNRLKSMRLAATALSYAGVVELAPAYGATHVLGLHGFVSNHPLGPEFTAAVRLFRDELWWDCVYLDTDLDEPAAQAVAGEIMQQLVEAAKSGPAA
jgi:hypothetical protein